MYRFIEFSIIQKQIFKKPEKEAKNFENLGLKKQKLLSIF